MFGTTNGSHTSDSRGISTTPVTGYARVPADASGKPCLYNGNPVVYDRATDDLAYEGLQEGQILPLPSHAEIYLRRQLELPKKEVGQARQHTSPEAADQKQDRLTRAGAFVTLTPALDWPDRRGFVAYGNHFGITLDVVSDEENGFLSKPVTEFWPWCQVLHLTAATPTPEEKAAHKVDAS